MKKTFRAYWAELRGPYRRPAVLSLLLHVALVIAVSVGWSQSIEVETVQLPGNIQASVVDPRMLEEYERKKQQKLDDEKARQKAAEDKKRKVALEKKREAEKQRKAEQQRKEQQKQQAEAKKQEAEKRAEALRLKKEKEEKQRKEREARERAEQEKAARERREQALAEAAREAEEERLRREAEIAEQQAIAAREREQALRAEQARQASERDKYMALIKNRITQRWHKPASAKPGQQVVLRIRLLPNGELVSVVQVSSSGNPALDQSAISAVQSLNKYPVPSDNALFEREFRQFRMSFSPED